jgi:N-acetylglutamate synthase-like GNAT family acetyltransferase
MERGTVWARVRDVNTEIAAFVDTFVGLDTLVVDPQCQRRGAGRMLVKWGTALADEMKVEVSIRLVDTIHYDINVQPGGGRIQ